MTVLLLTTKTSLYSGKSLFNQKGICLNVKLTIIYFLGEPMPIMRTSISTGRDNFWSIEYSWSRFFWSLPLIYCYVYMQFYRTLTLRWLMCVHESMKISTGCVLLVPKSHFCVLGFKRNWLSQIIDRDIDFWGLLDNLTFDLQFPEAEAQDTWHLSWIEHKIVSQPWKMTNWFKENDWVVLKSFFVYIKSTCLFWTFVQLLHGLLPSEVEDYKGGKDLATKRRTQPWGPASFCPGILYSMFASFVFLLFRVNFVLKKLPIGIDMYFVHLLLWNQSDFYSGETTGGKEDGGDFEKSGNCDCQRSFLFNFQRDSQPGDGIIRLLICRDYEKASTKA